MLGGQYLFLACFNNFLNLTTHMYVGSTWSALNDSVKRTKCGMPWICQMYFRPPDRVLLNNAVSSFSKLFLVLNPPSLIPLPQSSILYPQSFIDNPQSSLLSRARWFSKNFTNLFVKTFMSESCFSLTYATLGLDAVSWQAGWIMYPLLLLFV